MSDYPPDFSSWSKEERHAWHREQEQLRKERLRIAELNGSISEAPQPLIKRSAGKPYPVDELGDVLGPAAKAIAEKVQCVEALSAQSVLGVASLAAQALADVCLPYGQTRPLSLYLLTIASSGDRKTSADNEAMAPVHKREEQLSAEFEPLAKKHAAELAAWRGQRNQIERGKKDLAARRDEMSALGPEPPAPIRPYLTLGESTAEGTRQAYAGAPRRTRHFQRRRRPVSQRARLQSGIQNADRGKLLELVGRSRGAPRPRRRRID